MTDKETFEARRLVLGIDAGCTTCSDLGRRIEEKVGEKLEVRNLRDPQVEEWRKRALGEDAPWAPTLFEVKGFEVRAWTGPRMGLNLGRFLGPVATWRVMQALGEIDASQKANQAQSSLAVAGMSRGQFLRGVGGAAVAIGVLSGVGSFTRPAEALHAMLEFPSFTGSRRLRGTELKNYCNTVADRSDCAHVAGSYATALQTNYNVSSETDGTASNSYGVVARVFEHTTADGNEMYACTFRLKNERVITYYRYARPHQRVKTHITRWGLGPSPDGQRYWSERMAVNGALYTDPSVPSLQADCPTQCSDITGYFQQSICSSIGVACLSGAVGCGACVASCGSGVATGICLACIASTCPPAIVACCQSSCTVCIPCAPSI